MRSSAALLLATGLTLFPLTSAIAQNQPARAVWGRFETPSEVAAWRTSAVTIESSDKFATEGAHSARIHFRKYTGAPGEEEWPRISAPAGQFPADWSGWGALALDVSIASSESERVAIEIRDTAGRNGAVFSYIVPPNGTVHVVIPLASNSGDGATPKMNAGHIAEFLIFKEHPQRDADIFIDNIRLLRPEMTELELAVQSAATALDQLWTRQGNGSAQRSALEDLRMAATAPTLTIGQAKALTDRARQLHSEVGAFRLKPLRAFDFGRAGSPIRTGFAGVTAETRYSPAAGFGWRNTSGLKDATVPAQRQWMQSSYHGRKVPPRTYLNDLTQDLVSGDKPAEFVINVPPGDYTVWILSGYTDEHSPLVNDFTVNAGAGTGAGDVVISLPQPFIFESRFIPARAGADGLVVGFTPQTGFVINALAVFAQADQARAKKEVAGPIEQEVFQLPPDLWAQWRLVAHAPEKPAPPPSDEERQRGYVLFSRPYVQNIYPDSQPQPQERFGKLETFAAPGEHEPFTFAIQALRELNQVSVALPDGLTGPDGTRIPSTAFDLRQVRCWPVRTHYSAMDTYKVVPEILDPIVPTDLDSGICQRYWLTVRIPDDARAGLYHGAALIQSRNASAVSVPLVLEVLPFRLLRDPTKSFGNYYDSPLDKITPDMSPAVVAAIQRRAEAEARDMQEHGMTTVQMGGISARQENGQWNAVINLDRHIDFLRRFGLWGQAPGVMMNAFFVDDICKSYSGKRWSKRLIGATMPSQAYFDAVTRVIGQIEKTRLERGWPDFYYYPIDEASAEAMPILAATLAAIKKVPTAKTYATQIFELPASRPLDDVLDVWCSGEFCTNLPAIDAMRQKGRIFWCYPNFVACSRGVPNSARMTYGFGLWRMGYSCLIPWHYQAPVSNPYCDFDALYGDWCMAYPGPGGIPLPTQRWEAVRQGIIDGRYLYTLEARLAEAKQGSATPSALAAIGAGKALLTELRHTIPIRATYDQDGPWTGAEYAKYRRRLADAILGLTAR